MKTTNIEAVKEMAINLLKLPITVGEDDKWAPAIISHPFFNSGFSMNPNTQQLVNILESKKDYEEIISFLEQAIKQSDSVSAIFGFINPPYKRTFFKFVADDLGKEDFAKCLVLAWLSSESPAKDANVTMAAMKSWFRKADKALLMDKAEYEAYCNLPKEVTVYRGVLGDKAKYSKALSWTLSSEMAQKFADRFSTGQGVVFSAKINRENIFAYFDAEEEVVLDYNKLYDVKKV